MKSEGCRESVTHLIFVIPNNCFEFFIFPQFSSGLIVQESSKYYLDLYGIYLPWLTLPPNQIHAKKAPSSIMYASSFH